jgi:hypothetical protein
LVCAELVRSALRSMATRINHTDQFIIDMILELDSDTHSSEDEDTSAHHDSDTTDTNFTHWTDNTNC